AIVIEVRSRDEVANGFTKKILPDGVGARHPAFDVTPARLVTAIFTERGVIEPVGPLAVEALAKKDG
ncbi:MAG TPA: hypothetical protein VHU80_09065, partial [Polyangiaceae bacterium]|nr:hypothetical protein [Polyangiaceae bacterium]